MSDIEVDPNAIITPDDARELLKNNADNNRSIIPALRKKFAADMTVGRWTYTGDTIRISRTGRLLDGQHRLWAVIDTGIPLHTIVVRGLDDTSISRMDIGGRRSAADQLTVQATERVPSAKMVAAIGRRVLLWDGYGIRRGRGSQDLSVSEVSDYCAQPEVLAKLIRAMEIVRPAKYQAMVSAMHVILSDIDVYATAVFFHGLVTGAELGEGSPILALRNRLLSARTTARRDARETRSRMSDDILAELVCRAWDHYRAGRSVGRIQLGDPGAPYPEPW